MMKMIKLLVIFFMLCSLNSYAAQTIKWKNIPLKVNLQVGKERIIQVDDNVVIGVPASIKPYLKSESAQGYIYLTALKEFPKTRFKLRLKSNNEIILIDLTSTTEERDLPNLEIEVPSLLAGEERYSSSSTNVMGNVTPIQLTRFAARSFYGPDRLMKNNPLIRMQRIKKSDLSTLFTGTSSNVFSATAVAVFKAGKMHLTAIKLVNKTPLKQVINHLDINADFQFSTSQMTQVNQKNVAGDTTMLYLITDKPLSGSLYNQPKKLVTKGAKNGTIQSNS